VWVLCLVFATSTAVLTYLVAVRMPLLARAAGEPATIAEGAAGTASPTPAAPASRAAEASAAGGLVLDAKGYIIPARQILVSPEVSGRIIELNVVEGKRVTKGEVLARLDPKDFQDDVDRASAALELAQQRLLELETSRPEEVGAAGAELAEAEAQLVQLRAEWKRAEELRRRNVLSIQDYEVAESKYRAMDQRVARLRFALKLMEGSREKRIAAAKAEVNQAKAELSKAQWRLGKCTIVAPITGTILKKNAEEGNLVNPIAFNGSYSLCDMANLADLEVEMSIPEREISKVFRDQKCKVRSEAYPDRVYEGYVSRLMPIADRGKGAVPVRVKVLVPAEEEGVYLKPEMGAIVSFYQEKQK
jgi:multidrug resistance efflux pump